MEFSEIFGNSGIHSDNVKIKRILFHELAKPCPIQEFNVHNGTSFLHNNQDWSSGIFKVSFSVLDEDNQKVFEVIYFVDLKPLEFSSISSIKM